MSESRLFRCITGNVEMNTNPSRFKFILNTIKKNDPDAVFLQEITEVSLEWLKQDLNASKYEVVIPEGAFSYFTVTIINRSTANLKKTETVHFDGSIMLRSLLITEISGKEHTIHLINSHLESKGEYAEERKQQASTLFNRMEELSKHFPVIFAGDTNLRDYEMKQLGGLPQGTEDVWEFLGKPKDSKYTGSSYRFDDWDPSKQVYKHRYDRAFFRRSPEESITPKEIIPLGVQKLSSGHYPSDHIGLLISFSIQ